MKSLGIIKFVFGAATIEYLPTRNLDYYIKLSKEIVDAEIKLVDNFKKNTIPISKVDIASIKDIVHEFIRPWLDNVNVILVDFDDDQRANMFIAGAINEVLEQRPDLFLILLRSTLPESNDIFLRMLNKHIKKGNIIIIDDNGEFLANNVLNVYNIDKKEHYYQRIYKGCEKQLKAKMVRRPGHFKTYQGCVRYFYDGRYCKSELATLIKAWISKKYGEDYPKSIIYHQTYSKWLMDILTTVCNETGIDRYEIDEILSDKAIDKELLSPTPLIVLPLIDTGKTLKNIISKWDKRRLPKPIILSVLGTNELFENKKATVDVNNLSYKIECFLEVDRGREEDCYQCKHDIPPSRFYEEYYASLTSYDFWNIATESDWIPEINVPKAPERNQLELVPNFDQILKNHGPWLARKIIYRLAHFQKQYPTIPILIIAPEEDSTKRVTALLDLIHPDVSTVLIPKKIIDSIQNGQNLDKLPSKWIKSDWYEKLTKIGYPDQPAIIMEEFSYSGGTCSALNKLLRAVNIKPKCHFVILQLKNKQMQLPSGIKSLSLYEIGGFNSQVQHEVVLRGKLR
ncbi:MAG: hypothetical protein ACYCXF_06155 [Thermoleophilia bacterium]